MSRKDKKSKALLLSFVFALLVALFTTDVQNSYAQDEDEASALVTAADMEESSSEDDMSLENDDTSSEEDEGGAPSSSWAGGQAGPASAASSMQQQSWIVPSGASLQDILYQWCQKSGWSLVWNSEYVYTTQAGTTFKGDFLSALKGLFLAMDTASPKLYPVIYKGNKVIVVKNTSSH